MTIHLSKHLEKSIRSLVKEGRFSSVDEAMDEAARLLLQKQPASKPKMTEAEFDQHLLALGLMSALPTDDFDDEAEPEEEPITIRGEPLSQTVIRDRG